MAWKPAYATTADLAGWLGVGDDPELALAIEAASRAIDHHCGRQFGRDDTATSRVYQPFLHQHHWAVFTDDLMVTPIGVTDDNGTITDYTLAPTNAVAEGTPWRRIDLRERPVGMVEVTATFGWASVPDAIKQACLIQAARWYDRRYNISGSVIEKRVDDVEYKWGGGVNAAQLDTDVQALLAPYRITWHAA